jgi:hypothetical protein
MAGIGRDRLHLAWVSSAEAQRFVEVVKAVTDSVRQQGKFDPQAHALQLAAVESTLNGEPIRWLVGKEVRITTKGDVYGRRWDEDSFEKILDASLQREYQKNLILQAIEDGCASPRDVRDRTGLALKQISHLLADLEKSGQVEFKKMEAGKPVFAAL